MPGAPSVNCGLVNARSIKTVNAGHNELFNYKRMLELYELKLLVVVETWLDSNITDADLSVEGFNIHRKDRGSKGGGITHYQ